MSAEHHFRSLLTFTHLTAPSKSTFEGTSTECGYKTYRVIKKRNQIIFCNSISQEGFQSMQEQEQCRRQELWIHIAASEKIIVGTTATSAVGESDFICFLVVLRFGDIDVVVDFIISAELRGSEVDCGGRDGLCDEAGTARPAPGREQRVFWRRLKGCYSVLSRVSWQCRESSQDGT